jgi:hypothetical protein
LRFFILGRKPSLRAFAGGHTQQISMQPFARSVVRGGQQVLRAFKPKIQASKPKNNLDFAADAVVVSRISFKHLMQSIK